MKTLGCNHCKYLVFLFFSIVTVCANDERQALPDGLAAILSGSGNAGTSLLCGGALIHPSWVLTAAHCVADKPPADYEVVLGLSSLGLNPESQDRYQVVEVIVHPRYFFRNGQIDGDLALLRLDRPVTDHQPIRILEAEPLSSAESVVLTWDRLKQPRSLTPVEVIMLGRLEAQEVIGAGFLLDAIPISTEAENAIICHGDSGTPLLICQSGQWQLAGIMSYVVECDGHAVTTGLRLYRSWIVEHVFPRFSNWAQEYGVVRLWADDDGDGVTNFSEFALSADPTENSSTGALDVTASVPAGHPQLRFVHRSDVDFRVEHSEDLLTWLPLSSDMIDQEPLVNGENMQLIQASSNASLANVPKQFFRIASSPQQHASVPYVRDAPELYLRGDASLLADAEQFESRYLVSGLIDGTTIFNFQAPLFTPRLRIVDTQTGATLLDVGEGGTHSLMAELQTNADTHYELVLSSLDASPRGGFVFHYPRLLGAPLFIELNRQAVRGVLNESSNFDGNYYSNSYQIIGGLTGELVSLTLASDQDDGGFRPFLVVLDDGGQTVSASEGMPTNSTEVSYIVESNKTYFAFASTLFPNQLGNFTLTGNSSR